MDKFLITLGAVLMLFGAVSGLMSWWSLGKLNEVDPSTEQEAHELADEKENLRKMLCYSIIGAVTGVYLIVAGKLLNPLTELLFK